MGALEFEPATGKDFGDRSLEVAQLVELASMAFADKETLDTRLAGEDAEQAMLDILSVGTSAGGARAKAVIAFDPDTRQVRSGQLDLPEGYEHWLIKFDGVEFSGDWGVADPAGYGLLEYSYSQVAQRCGVEMMECRLLRENGRQPLHDAPLRPRPRRRQAVRADVRRARALRLLRERRLQLRAAVPDDEAAAHVARGHRSNSSSGAWCSTSSAATRTTTSRTRRS